MNKNPTVKVGWSGGKDSTCAVMQHIEHGHKVKAVCYIPMFTESIPLIEKTTTHLFSVLQSCSEALGQTSGS